MNIDTSLKYRIYTKEIYDFLISTKDKYVDFIIEESYDDKVKIEKLAKIYSSIKKVNFLYKKSNINMCLTPSLLINNDILSKIDE
jgi:hypothetical protein